MYLTKADFLEITISMQSTEKQHHLLENTYRHLFLGSDFPVPLDEIPVLFLWNIRTSRSGKNNCRKVEALLKAAKCLAPCLLTTLNERSNSLVILSSVTLIYCVRCHVGYRQLVLITKEQMRIH